MSRTLNYQIGEQILEIIYRYEPLGIWYCQLQREGHFYSKTLTSWLKHLRAHNILLYTSARFIHFTKKSKEDYEKGDLFVPGVQIESIKKKNRLMPNNRLLWKRRACHGILHVLFLNARLITEPNEIYVDENGIEWSVAIHRPAVKADTTKKLERIYKKDNLYPAILENRISGVSYELFRHLELSDAKAKEYYQFLKDYKPSSYKSYPILTERERYYNNQIVYEIKDKLLQEFINRCLIVFNSGVFLILRYYHKTDRLKKNKGERNKSDRYKRKPDQ